jgi:uncharacterized membrane protein YoaK (UPF0700 family)
MADKGTPAPLLVALVALTVVSGLVDAVCYLGLGRVFTANMTAGASAYLHKGPALPLLIAALVVAVTGTAFGLSQRRGATMVA